MYRKCLIVLALAVCCLAGSAPILRKPVPDGRIVGGQPTTIDKVPYQLSLMSSGSHICGASIISSLWAVTAAHCVKGASASLISLRSGSSSRISGGNVTKVSDIIVHSGYNANTMSNDIALLKVITPFPVGSSGVKAVNLPNQGETISAGTNSIVSGWGKTSENSGSLPSTVQQVTVPIVSDTDCNNAYKPFGGITVSMICAGYTQGGKDACQGDSGGPLVANGKLVGIVSWGYGCAKPNYPGVYSRVAYLRNWIKQNCGV